MQERVSVTIVTHNDAQHLERCFRSLLEQDYRPIDITVVDNASSDASVALLSAWRDVRVIRNSENRGFSAAQNQAIAATDGDWVLCLNPDTLLQPDFVRQLVFCGRLVSHAGIICPKILRLNVDGSPTVPRVIDSAGCYFTPWLRHHDRGSQQIDVGQYDRPEYVFGYTGAAVLFRRAMIQDISIEGEFMDEDFFFYREDADISWRAQLLDWRCVYTPFAVAYHVRRVFETNRSSLPPAINLHSTKNRFLMRIKNITAGVYRRVFPFATIRDLGILGYVLVRERSSLPGLWFVVRHFSRTWKKRKWIQSRRDATDAEIASWFRFQPTTRPLEPELMAALLTATRPAGSPVATSA